MIIYKATNKLTLEFYVGCTVKTLTQRRACHISSAKRQARGYFHKAIQKYGEDSFEWEILEICNSKEAMLASEIKWIEELSPSYNLTKGGEGCHGRILSEATKKRIADSMLGKSPANKGKPSPFRGIKRGPRSQEVKELISQNRKGKPAWNKGQAWSESTRKKIADSKIGWMPSDDHLAKMRAARPERHSFATRQKMSAAKFGKPRSPTGQFLKLVEPNPEDEP